jgi:putative endonuclease
MTSDARPVDLRTTKARGDEAQRRALAHLTANGLVPVERNYRVAPGPRARGGEIDLILREPDGTLVFVDVRARGDARHGGAAATVDFRKQQRLVFAARSFLWPVRGSAALPFRCRHGRRRADPVAARGLRCLVKRS